VPTSSIRGGPSANTGEKKRRTMVANRKRGEGVGRKGKGGKEIASGKKKNGTAG